MPANRSENRNTLGDADLGYLSESIDYDRGFSDELPDGALKGRSNANGDDYLAYETELEKTPDFDDFGNWEKYELAIERAQMHGGFIERPGLTPNGYDKGDIERS